MNKEKTYTVKDLSELFGVTKSAIQHYLTEQFRNKYVTEVTGKGGKQLRINQLGYEELCSIFKSDKSSKKSTNKFTGESDKEETIKILKQQIDEKDKQLERMQLLLNQSQQLQLKESKKLERLELKEEERQKEQESNKESDILDNTEKQEQVEKKKGFWSRIFK